jgi:hypothetical protein
MPPARPRPHRRVPVRPRRRLRGRPQGARTSLLPPSLLAAPRIQVLRSRARGLVDRPPDLGRLSGRDPRAAGAGLVASVLVRGLVFFRGSL